MWWDIGGWKRSFFNRPNIPLRFTVKRPYTNTYTHIYLYIIYINDKKPVSSSGTIKMWQAAARPLAFAFFSRTHRAQFVGRNPSYTYTHTTRSYTYIGTFLLLLFYVLATTSAVAHKKCSLILCFWTANSYWGLHILYIYIYTHDTHAYTVPCTYIYIYWSLYTLLDARLGVLVPIY